MRIIARVAVTTFLFQAGLRPADREEDAQWTFYGRDAGGSKYSPLRQINRENVKSLQHAWTYRTGDSLERAKRGGRRPAFEATPLFVDGVLFFSTPNGRVIALDLESVQAPWTFDARIEFDASYGDFANRGLATWLDPQLGDQDPCRRRLYLASIDARLISLDARTGRPCSGFGSNGEIDLKKGLRILPHEAGEYEQTSPPLVIRGLVVVGSAIADNTRVSMPSGEVRAFDARTGQLKWTWHPIPVSRDDPATGSWNAESARQTGGANAWSILSGDEERGLVFVPTGSASPDYYGGLRAGDNLYANSVVALRAEDGRRIWHFQTVHHDLWDYDVASQPALFTLRRGGAEVPAVTAGSKTGHLFLLHRETGRPLFPVEERPVPASDVPGEKASPTQPFPVRPPALVPHRLDPEDAWGPTESDRKHCQDQIAAWRNDGIFTPPSLRGSVVYPGNIGGLAWGGVAWDPNRNLLIVPANRLAAAVRLVPQKDFDSVRRNSPDWETTRQRGTPYAMSRTILRSPSGLPCTPPPWSTLSAIDTTSGQIRWQVPLGSLDVPGYSGVEVGGPHLGGPIVTGGGLVFIGATLDPHIRAFDVASGSELWRAKLPSGARSTPMTFLSKGKQYVVIAVGGHDHLLSPPSDTLVAFRLP